MPGNPAVTVITPTYNHRHFIASCIESVLAQTFEDWEMIVIDDGSTDDTLSIAAKYADSRISLIAQENVGVWRLSETYNRALQSASGRIVAILEGDDLWPKDKLQAQAHDFDDPSVVLSSGRTQILMSDGSVGVTPKWTPPEDAANNTPVGRAAKLMMHPDSLTYTFPVSTMVRAETLRRIGGFQQPADLPLVDLPTFLRLTLEGQWRFHTQIMGCWRRHERSVTSGSLSQILESAYRHVFEFLNQYRDRLPLTDQELDELQRAWDETSFNRCILRGRMLASQGKRRLASRAIAEALLYRTAGKALLQVAIARLVLAWGLPLEPVYKLARRGRWEEGITLDTGDRVVSEADMQRPRFVGRWRQA